MKTLILASASPRRREILKQVGIDFTVIPSTKEEVITKQEPKDAVMELALQKAEDVAGRADGDCMVIGADTVVAMEGSILGKPVDKDDAARMLRMLSGSRHQVYTGVACICGEKKHVFYEETSVFFRSQKMRSDAISRRENRWIRPERMGFRAERPASYGELKETITM